MAYNQVILVVEDRPERRAYLETLLKDNYDVVTVESGGDCLSEAVCVAPDLILVDMQMRDMSGLDVHRTLKEEELTQNIPIALLSSFKSLEPSEEFTDGFPMTMIDFDSPHHLKEGIEHLINR